MCNKISNTLVRHLQRPWVVYNAIGKLGIFFTDKLLCDLKPSGRREEFKMRTVCATTVNKANEGIHC